MGSIDPVVLTVTQLTRLVKSEIETEPQLQNILVRGEVSGVSRPASGHLYFTLKDETSQIPCVLFRRRLGSKPTFTGIEHGMKVICAGSLTVYESGGKYQLKVDEVFAEGLGELHLQVEELKKRLQAEGLFAEEKKRPLPSLPRKIGVVTSATGAVIKDIVTVSRRRYANIGILLAPALVQGPGAPASLVAALKELYSQTDVDVIIIGRGGGSFEELSAFNDESVVRTIAAAPVPIVAAVGHETDFTIADLVADRRAPTPSAAAEIVVPLKRELSQRVENLLERVIIAVNRKVYLQRKDLAKLSAHRYLTNPRLLLEGKAQQVDELSTRLWRYGLGNVKDTRPRLENLERRMAVIITAAVRESRIQAEHCTTVLQSAIIRNVEVKRAKQERLIAKLETLSPLRTLARGYSICQDALTKQVLTKSEQVSLGQAVTVRLKQGSLQATVTEIREEKA